MSLEVWAGIECSVVRVGDRYVDQLALTGHDRRLEDLDRLAALGVRAVRYPILWERTHDFRFADERLGRLHELGVRPVIGLVHHGSGPPRTSLLDDSFVHGLARFAREFAERYPWVTDYTPVNEPLTTARFSALYGHWYPHARSDRAFVRALVVQCRAIGEAMRAIRNVVPAARLVQTEDLGTVFSTPKLADQACFENHRRFLSLDLLAGRVDREHPLWRWLTDVGEDFTVEPCLPDIIGMNHYVTSDRFLDDRATGYPPERIGGNGRDTYADVEAVRVRGPGVLGHRALLELLWERYRLPLAITEVHLGCHPEDQVRWLHEAWTAARTCDADVRAVTVWSAFGASDWDSLLTEPRGHYEPGLFDVRGGIVRPTALATVARDLATRGESDHPVLAQPGWWRRPERLAHPAFGPVARPNILDARPILLAGAGGTLGRAIERVCHERGVAVVGLDRGRLDITNRHLVARALDTFQPWAVVNAAGYVRVDDAEGDRRTCLGVNTAGAAILAEACATRRVRYVTFSSDLVFDGERDAPYVESDRPCPLNVYGRSKMLAEQLVSDRCAAAMIVRTSAFFGPWDEASFICAVLRALEGGDEFRAVSDLVVSPTYVPDLAHATLTLLVDGAEGLWHLASGGATTWLELARRVAERAGLNTDLLVGCHARDLLPAPRPVYSALASERGSLMAPFEDGLDRFFAQRASTGTPSRKAS
jgi:dTDP-4-dehydrorhamnose reductase